MAIPPSTSDLKTGRVTPGARLGEVQTALERHGIQSLAELRKVWKSAPERLTPKLSADERGAVVAFVSLALVFPEQIAVTLEPHIHDLAQLKSWTPKQFREV